MKLPLNIVISDNLKQIILCQLVSDNPLNILIVGDPSTGKTSLLKQVASLKNDSKFVVNDLDTALNCQHLCIDDLSLLNDIENSLVRTLFEKKIPILAGTRPTWGRFDPYELVNRQLNIPLKAISKFHFIYVLKDLPDKKLDMKKAETYFSDDLLDVDGFNEMLNECRCIRPIISDDIKKKIIDLYVMQRTYVIPEKDDCVSEIIVGGYSSYSSERCTFNMRHLDTLKLVSVALAKLDLSEKVTARHVDAAMNLITESIKTTSSEGDIDIFEIGMTSRQKEAIATFRKVFNTLEEQIGPILPIDALVKECGSYGIGEDSTETLIERFKRVGDVFEPRRGFLQKR